MPDHPATWTFLLGRLSLEALPLDNPIVLYTFAAVALGGIALLATITYYRKWGYLWNEWFTSVDHKKLGIMYMILATVMLFSLASVQQRYMLAKTWIDRGAGVLLGGFGIRLLGVVWR